MRTFKVRQGTNLRFAQGDGRMKCSFCGRRDSEVEKLVAGPVRLCGRIYICDRCAYQTIAIMEGKSADDDSRVGRQS